MEKMNRISFQDEPCSLCSGLKKRLIVRIEEILKTGEFTILPSLSFFVETVIYISAVTLLSLEKLGSYENLSFGTSDKVVN